MEEPVPRLSPSAADPQEGTPMRSARPVAVAAGVVLLLLGIVLVALTVVAVVALPVALALGLSVLALVAGVGSHLRARTRRLRRRPPSRPPSSGPGRPGAPDRPVGSPAPAGPPEGWVTGWDTAPSPDLVPLVRERVADVLAGWGLTGEAAEPALLVVTELLSNATDHARGPVRVTVAPADDAVRVEVRDGAPDPPQLQPPDPWRERGRGLQMVEAVSDRWGWERDGAGKVVWADVRTAWPG